MERLTMFEGVNMDIHRLLSEFGYYDGRDYSVFTRPNHHLIIETTTDARQSILEVLSTRYDVIENDSWCGGNRLGIIIDRFYDEINYSSLWGINHNNGYIFILASANKVLEHLFGKDVDVAELPTVSIYDVEDKSYFGDFEPRLENWVVICEKDSEYEYVKKELFE